MKKLMSVMLLLLCGVLLNTQAFAEEFNGLIDPNSKARISYKDGNLFFYGGDTVNYVIDPSYKGNTIEIVAAPEGDMKSAVTINKYPQDNAWYACQLEHRNNFYAVCYKTKDEFDKISHSKFYGFPTFKDYFEGEDFLNSRGLDGFYKTCETDSAGTYLEVKDGKTKILHMRCTQNYQVSGRTKSKTVNFSKDLYSDSECSRYESTKIPIYLQGVGNVANDSVTPEIKCGKGK